MPLWRAIARTTSCQSERSRATEPYGACRFGLGVRGAATSRLSLHRSRRIYLNALKLLSANNTGDSPKALQSAHAGGRLFSLHADFSIQDRLDYRAVARPRVINQYFSKRASARHVRATAQCTLAYFSAIAGRRFLRHTAWLCISAPTLSSTNVQGTSTASFALFQ